MSERFISYSFPGSPRGPDRSVSHRSPLAGGFPRLRLRSTVAWVAYFSLTRASSRRPKALQSVWPRVTVATGSHLLAVLDQRQDRRGRLPPIRKRPPSRGVRQKTKRPDSRRWHPLGSGLWGLGMALRELL